jgi:bifunctional non-homologous end joining protein LigD
MLASTGAAPLDSPDFAYEPKYDGIRAIAVVGAREVTLWSRLGNQKTTQFPEIVDALQTWARHRGAPAVLDGEIVALDSDGQPAGFQNLQGRIHVKDAPAGQADARTAFIVFDLLFDGAEDLRHRPLRERRARLEPLLQGVTDSRLRISDQVVGSGRALYERAKQAGWEGLVAKRLDSIYKSGRRSPEWCKLKLVRHQTCVVGGWTEPRGSRPFFGALLLGVHDADGGLQYIGHTGAGFTDAELGRVWKHLQALKSKTSPFTTTPRTNEKPHWTKPRLVVEVKFTEWTADGKLRHPTYLGIRDDVKVESVRKEPDISRPAVRASVHRATRAAEEARHLAADSSRVLRAAKRAAVARAASRRGRTSDETRRSDVKLAGSRGDVRRSPSDSPGGSGNGRTTGELSKADRIQLLGQLDAIESSPGDGVLELPDGSRLEITNLRKVFWPARTGPGKMRALTKGDLFRHYVRVAAYLLPALADRPLVMKRYPNGVAGKPFYQHRAPDKVPPGVRVQPVEAGSETREHLVAGSLVTLLYTAQLGSISQDPWFSRVGSEQIVDHVAIDLDPPDGLAFGRVLELALRVRDTLADLKTVGFPKTSGSGGLHVYIPMPPQTTYDAGLLYCQIVATLVATRFPKLATVERSVAARGNRIYVDYLQNIQGKTLASAYSPRANDFAGVSTPLSWDDVEAGVRPQDFTIANFETRLEEAGDLWAGLRKAKGADLRAVTTVTGGRKQLSRKKNS